MGIMNEVNLLIKVAGGIDVLTQPQSQHCTVAECFSVYPKQIVCGFVQLFERDHPATSCHRSVISGTTQ